MCLKPVFNRACFVFSFLHDVSHAALYKIAIPILIFLWILCIIYALLIYPGRILFWETYLVDEEGTNCTCSVVVKKSEKDKNERRESRLYEIDLMIVDRKEFQKLGKCLSCSDDGSKKDLKNEEANTMRPHSFTLWTFSLNSEDNNRVGLGRSAKSRAPNCIEGKFLRYKVLIEKVKKTLLALPIIILYETNITILGSIL